MSKHYPKIEIFGTKSQKMRAWYREHYKDPATEVTIGSEKWEKMPANKLKRAIELKAVIYAGKIMHEAQELAASLVTKK